MKRTLSVLLICLFLLSVGASASETARRPTSFQQAITDFRTELDGGADTQGALERLGAALSESDLSVADLDLYLKKNLTAREHEAFKKQIRSSLNGIDPSQLLPSEWIEIANEALSKSSSQGLSWSDCTAQDRWLAFGLLTAGVGLLAYDFYIQSDGFTARNDFEQSLLDLEDRTGLVTIVPFLIAYVGAQLTYSVLRGC